MKRLLLSVLLITACAGTRPEAESSGTQGGIYQVVNRSACVARIVLYDPEGTVIDNIKYEDLRAGRTQRYRLPTPGMTLAAVAIDTMGNACSMAENQKIQVTRVQ